MMMFNAHAQCKRHNDLSSITSSIDDHSKTQTNLKEDHFPLRIKFMEDDCWTKTILEEDHSNMYTKFIDDHWRVYGG